MNRLPKKPCAHFVRLAAFFHRIHLISKDLTMKRPFNCFASLFIIFLLLINATTALVSPAALYAQDDTYPPGTIQMTPKVDLNLETVALEVPEKFRAMVPENLSLNLPSGFTVKVFAVDGLRGPRMMAFNQEGVLHVANMKANGSSEFQPSNNSTSEILALPDWDNDGVADTVIVAADALRWANSLTFYNGDMYVADTHQIVKFTDNDGDLIYESREVFADNIPTASSPHITRTIVADEAKERFYLSVGSSCDVCREDDPERATVLEFSADGTERRVFATGLRNAIGLDVHPLSGDLWATNNGHTEVDNTMPPEWIDIVRDGGFYGWPLAFGYQVYIDFDFRGHWRVPPITRDDSLLVQTMERPAALIDAHSSPMGIHFYPADNFPSEYHNAAFVAYRSGFRGPDPGHKVVAMFMDADGDNARVGDFMTGFWPNPPDQSNIWGKPVGLTTDSDGSLYLSSDWINHLILKVEYNGEATSIEDDESPELPLATALEQNYPNPFNPVTKIGYSLKESTSVTLEIFDALGRKVATLVDGYQSAGRYQVDFNASKLSSGVYLYRLKAGDYTESKLLTLMK